MQQCSGCQRFLSDHIHRCPFCLSRDISVRRILPAPPDELKDYRILARAVTIQDQEYRLIDIIGQGSHGVVLKVKGPDRKTYALKLPLQFNELFSNSGGSRKSVLELSRKYLAHEVKMLNQVKSEALVEVFYAGPVCCRGKGKEAELPAILMELAAGTLKDIIDLEMANRLTVPYGERLDIIRQLSERLETLHRQKIIHRDLSPHNVFIVDRHQAIRYVLADFGTSKPAMPGENRDSSTRMAFHDRYLDPAILMVKNFRYDHRIDIYQLGVIFTEVLLGEYWRSEDDETSGLDFGQLDFEKEFLLKCAQGEIGRPLLRRLRRATSLSIDKRYASAGAFSKAMHKALAKEEKRSRNPRQRRAFRRTIIIAYRVTIPAAADSTGSRLPTLCYRGQRRLDMGRAEAIQINFPDFRLRRARFGEPTFLKCRREGNTVILRLDSRAIDKKIRPLRRIKTVGSDPAFHLEFEAKARLAIAGSLPARGTPCTGE
jgi:serine/threonine protein kinase